MDIKLPHLGEGADSGTVVNVLVKEGDTLVQDQPILELENEKAIATIPSPAAGTVSKVLVRAGDKISVGQTILSLTGGGKAAAKAPEPAAPKPAASQSAPASPRREPPPASQSPGPAPAASPAIRSLVRDLGINLSQVRGTGRGGRVEMGDLRAYLEHLQALADEKSGAPQAAPAKPAPEPIDFSKWGPVTKKPLSSLRQVIARRLSENWNAVPQVTQFGEADITRLLALRKEHLAAFEKKGARLTVTTFVLRAVVETLKKNPIFNSSLDETSQEIVTKNYYHLGIAVDTEAGLIVPVLRDADKKDLTQLSRELEELATRARDRKISSDELKGGSFTISNQGGIGGGAFTPLVNRPEAAILGLGRAVAQAVVREGKIVSRTKMPLALSYDHRLIDGANAARFMVDLVAAMEQFDEKELK